VANVAQRTAAQTAALAPVQLVAGRTGNITLGISDITDLGSTLSGKAASVHSHAISDVTGLSTDLASRATTTAVNSALASKADLVGGVIPADQLPALAISVYLGAAANQSAMLALNGQRGDWCNRTDTGTAWILGADDYTSLASWVELNYPAAPVTSVNGYTGSFSLTASDVNAQPVDATLTAWAALATGANKLPYFTGTDTCATTDFTALARTLAAHTTAGQYRDTLSLVPGVDVLAPTGDGSGLTGLEIAQITDLGTMASQDASAVAITGGSIGGITDLAIVDGGTGASTAADARTNLGLGSMAVQGAASVAITGGTITGMTSPSGSSDVATKGYVDGLISSPLSFKSSTDCSSNPNYPSATKGDLYLVSVAGKIGGASGIAVEIGDMYLAISTNVGGTQASVGSHWTLIEHNLQGALLAANNLLDVASASAALANLGGQTAHASLTAISGLLPTNDDILQYKSGGWTNRTIAQIKTDLAYGTMSSQDANAVSISGGTVNGAAVTGLSNPSASGDAANKAYVDAAVIGLGVFQSNIDCSANPNYPAASKGWQYYVNVAGRIGGVSGPVVEVGDVIQAKANSSAGDHATVGGNWLVLQGNLVGAVRGSNNGTDFASASTTLANLGGQAASAALNAVVAAGISTANQIWYSTGANTLATTGLSSQGRTLIANSSVANMRSFLGLVIGTDVQAYDADLAAIAALTTTSYGRSVLETVDAAALRTLAGCGSMATQSASAVAITGGTITGLSTPSGSTDAATKGYVDTAVTGLLEFKGSTDCSANPNYPAASKGDTYVVTVAGKIGGASGKTVDVSDMYLCTADAASGNEAAVGTSWVVLEHNLVGAVLAANNLSDLTNTTTARSNLGVAIGSQVQAYNADLAGIATLNTNGIPVRTTAGTYAARTITGTSNKITVTNGDGVGGNPTLTVGSTVCQTDVATVLTKQQNFGAVALTSSSASIAWDLDNAQSAYHVMTENTTLASPTNMVAGATYVLAVVNHASSPKTLGFNSVYKWITGDDHTIPATNGSKTLFTFYCYNGTEMWCVSTKGFA